MKNQKIMTISEIKRKAVPILKRAKVRRASIFGSYARGNTRIRSDVDILIDAPRGMGLEFVGLKMDLEEALGKKVHLGEFSAIRPRIKEQVLNEQVRIV